MKNGSESERKIEDTIFCCCCCYYTHYNATPSPHSIIESNKLHIWKCYFLVLAFMHFIKWNLQRVKFFLKWNKVFNWVLRKFNLSHWKLFFGKHWTLSIIVLFQIERWKIDFFPYHCTIICLRSLIMLISSSKFFCKHF